MVAGSVSRERGRPQTVGELIVKDRGTKIRANASRAATRTESQLKNEIAIVEGYVGKYLDDLETTDREEDEKFGKEQNGYMLPAHLVDEKTRKSWIKAELEELHQDDQDDNADNDSKKDNADKDTDSSCNSNAKIGSTKEHNGKAPKSKLSRKLRKLVKARKKLEEKEKKRKDAKDA